MSKFLKAIGLPSKEEWLEDELDEIAKKGEREMEEERKEEQQNTQASDDVKFVIDGAKLECQLCTNPEGTLKVLLDTPKTQDKRTATVAEKDSNSLVFMGNCKKSPWQSTPCKVAMQLTEWQDIGKGLYQDNAPLLLKSTIICAYGGVPIKITDCGQRNKPQKVNTESAPLPIHEDARIIDFYYTDKDGNCDVELTYGDDAFLVLETEGMIGEVISIKQSEGTIDFLYDGKRIKNNQIKDYKIQSNQDRIAVQVIPEDYDKLD
ncbi:MAG: DUF4280 domain-containing protein [Bacteroidales bacterium]